MLSLYAQNHCNVAVYLVQLIVSSTVVLGAANAQRIINLTHRPCLRTIKLYGAVELVGKRDSELDFHADILPR